MIGMKFTVTPEATDTKLGLPSRREDKKREMI
jgi:hypothetical protein